MKQIFFDAKDKEYVTMDVLKCNWCKEALEDRFFLYNYQTKTKYGILVSCMNCVKDTKKRPSDVIASLQLVRVVNKLKESCVPVLQRPIELQDRKDLNVWQAVNEDKADGVRVVDKAWRSKLPEYSWEGAHVGITHEDKETAEQVLERERRRLIK